MDGGMSGLKRGGTGEVHMKPARGLCAPRVQSHKWIRAFPLRRFALDLVKDVDSGGSVLLYRLGYASNLVLQSVPNEYAGGHGPRSTCRLQLLKWSHGIAQQV